MPVFGYSCFGCLLCVLCIACVVLCLVYGDGGDDDDDDDSDDETNDDNGDDDDDGGSVYNDADDDEDDDDDDDDEDDNDADDDDDDDDEGHLGPSWSVLESSWSPLEALLARPGLQASWMPHFFEDVSGESLIFNIERLKTKLSTSQFLEDVSGETAISEYSGDFATDLNITIFGGCLRRNAHF